jgi:hypothetical protein
MNNPLDPTLRPLNDCGCCEGTTAETPVALENRPGLDAIDFRAGKHPQFKATMLAALTTAGHPALRNLRTRDDDDFTIALLDGWATVADVLSFYSERIANESFLRTATERRSILELARSIGYELNPGVAASTWLAFTVEEAEGAPGYANIDKGTKVQSIPGPDEKPQVFETIAPLFARKEWNELHAKSAAFILPYFGMTQIHLQGTTTNLNPGDLLLIVGQERVDNPGSENWDLRRVKALQTFPNSDAAKAYTAVTLDHPLGSSAPHVEPAKKNPKVFALRQRAALFGANAADWNLLPEKVRTKFGGTEGDTTLGEWPGFTISSVSEPGLYGEYFNDLTLTNRKLARVDSLINFTWGAGPPAPGINADTFSIRWTGFITVPATGNYGFRAHVDDGVRLWIDGELILDDWNAKPPRNVDSVNQKQLEAGKRYSIKLEFFENTGDAQIQLFWTTPSAVLELVPSSALIPRDIETIHLDAVYSGIVPQSWIVLSTPDYQEVYRVSGVAEDSPARFGLSAKSTKLTLEGENLRQKFNDRIRETVVFAQSEELPWVLQPFYAAVFGEEITLDKAVPDLPSDQNLVVSGLPARVRVTDAGASLELTLANGNTRSLNTGDPLSLVGPPVAQLDTPGISRWDLQMVDGTTGLLFASADQLEFVAGRADGARLLETVVLKRTEKGSDGSSRLVLTGPLKYAYDPTTMLIYGNAAFATHGETTSEVLGSGDANQPHQHFVLKETPLTYTPAANASGGESTLEIWVNDVKWREAPTLFGAGPRDRIYIVRLADDGKATVLFGDGKSGARLPTGNENVRAVYRKGIGHEGLLKANQLTLLMTRPLGAKSVTNPEATEGAADPQVFADARQNAPTTVLTLDRVVSLEDYEDFARNFSGVAKALATWTWNVNSRGIFLTVAGLAGVPIAPDSSIRSDLLKALRDLGNPLLPAEVKTFKPVKFGLAGTVFVDADRVPEKVETAVKDALKAAFSFDARSFGQPVALSEVEAVIQNVSGVAFVDLDALYLGSTAGLQHYLPAQRPDAGAAVGTVFPAELLTLDEASLSALKMTTI